MTKWEIDRIRYRSATDCHRIAEHFGIMAVAHILTITSNASGAWEFPIPASGLDRAEEDAVMFARMAYRGWRALQQANHDFS